ncbi:MAG: YqaA family protein [Gemmatimonadota bacterium]
MTAAGATAPRPKGDRKGGEGPIRRLFHWVLGWADRPGGPVALTAIAAAESFFFPVPPDVLLIPMALGRPRRALHFAALCTMGSVLGGMIGYWIGAGLYESVGRGVLEFYGLSGRYEQLGHMYAEHLVVSLGTAGFTPIPYKVFTIAAGGFSVPFAAFVSISAVSRGARFFLVAGLLALFGESIREFIERYFNLLSLLLVVLVVLGFLVLGLIF